MWFEYRGSISMEILYSTIVCVSMKNILLYVKCISYLHRVINNNYNVE